MKIDPAPILLKFLEVDAAGIPQDSLQNALLYIEHGECGVAYDLIVYHIINGDVMLTDAGLERITAAAAAMGIRYPDLSTG